MPFSCTCSPNIISAKFAKCAVKTRTHGGWIPTATIGNRQILYANVHHPGHNPNRISHMVSNFGSLSMEAPHDGLYRVGNSISKSQPHGRLRNGRWVHNIKTDTHGHSRDGINNVAMSFDMHHVDIGQAKNMALLLMKYTSSILLQENSLGFLLRAENYSPKQTFTELETDSLPADIGLQLYFPMKGSARLEGINGSLLFQHDDWFMQKPSSCSNDAVAFNDKQDVELHYKLPEEFRKRKPLRLYLDDQPPLIITPSNNMRFVVPFIRPLEGNFLCIGFSVGGRNAFNQKDIRGINIDSIPADNRTEANKVFDNSEEIELHFKSGTNPDLIKALNIPDWLKESFVSALIKRPPWKIGPNDDLKASVEIGVK